MGVMPSSGRKQKLASRSTSPHSGLVCNCIPVAQLAIFHKHTPSFSTALSHSRGKCLQSQHQCAFPKRPPI